MCTEIVLSSRLLVQSPLFQMKMSTPEPLFSLRCAKGEVTSISFLKCLDNDGVNLVTGHSTGDIQLWNSETNRTKLVWPAHKDDRVKWVGTGNGKVFSFGRDEKLCVWDNSSGKVSLEGSIDVDCITHCPCDVTELGSTVLLAVPQNNESVDVVDANGFSSVATFASSGHGATKYGMVMFVKFVYFGSTLLLLVGYESGSLAVFPVLSGNGSASSRLVVHPEPLTCFDVHAGSMRGISGSVDTALVTWKIDPSDFRLSLDKRVSITNAGVQSIAIHPAGLYVAVGGWDSRIRIFSWKSLKPLAVMDFHSATVNCLAFCRLSDTTVHLACGSKDGRVSVWDLYNDPLK